MMIAVIISLAAAVAPLFSQYYFLPYYGKNKVMRQGFKWQMAETANFRIHYYVENPGLIKRIAAISEKAYEKMSKLLNIKFDKKVPIIFYKSHIDFEQTNVYPGFLPPTAIAFADAFSRRVVIQGDLPGGDLARTIVHELGHVFEYTLLGRAVIFRPPPQWVMEGFADYITEHWQSFDLLVERDSVLFDLIPEMTPSGDLEYQMRHGRSDYNWGHFLYEFIEGKFGPRGVRQLLYSFRGGAFGSGAPGGGKRGFLGSLNYTPKLFNYEFRKYMRDKFKKFVARENPEDYSFSIGPDLPYAYSFSHQLSPSGELLAVLTVNMKVGQIDIILISMKDGKIIKNITPGFSSRYDDISFQFDPTDGISIAWDKNGEKIAFFARKELDNFLFIIDALSGKTQERIKLKDIEGPASPVFHPDNKGLYFTGIDNSRYFLYYYDLASSQVKKITSGLFTIKSFNISPDGKKFVFSVLHDKYNKLYLAPLESPETAMQLTDGEYNDITPMFSRDGKTIYYSSDELESYNLYSLDLENKMIYRYTDVRSGNFFPMEIPGETKQLVFSSFYKTRFHLFKKDIANYLDKRQIEFPVIAKEGQLEQGEPAAIKPTEQEAAGVLTEGRLAVAKALGLEEKESVEPVVGYKEAGKYKPFKTLFLSSYTPVTGAIGTDGSVMGYTNLTFSDIMNDHQLQFYAFSYFGYRSYSLSYLNMSNRLQYFGLLYYYTDALWLNYNEYLKIRERVGGTAGFFYPFNRSYRAELSLSLHYQEERYDEYYSGSELPYSQFFDGPAARVSLSLVGDTILYARYGPNMGHTFLINFEKYLKLRSNFLDAYSINADLKKYVRLNNNTLLAFRLSGFFSKGKYPQLYWFGGDNTIRATEFRQLVGNNAFFFNVEFRFPLISLANTILGFMGPIRGVFFYDIGGVWLDENPDKFQFFYEGRGLRNLFKKGSVKLKDGISSYGFGLVCFLFGYPMHFDWVYQTDLYAHKYYGFNFWIGFDF